MFFNRSVSICTTQQHGTVLTPHPVQGNGRKAKGGAADGYFHRPSLVPPPLTALEAVRSGASPSPHFLLLLSTRSSSTDSEAPLVHAIPTECHPASCWEAFVGHRRPGSRHTAQPQLLAHWISLICPPCVTPTPVWILLHVRPHPGFHVHLWCSHSPEQDCLYSPCAEFQPESRQRSKGFNCQEHYP